MPTVTNHGDKFRQGLLQGAVYLTEASVIGVTLWSGYNLTGSHGGSLAMGAPLFLIAAVELTRVPLAAWGFGAWIR